MSGRTSEHITEPLTIAPASPYALTLRTPLLAAAGCVGFGVELLPETRTALGALVTSSVAARGRRPTAPAQLRETPAGVLVSGWAEHAASWAVGRHSAVWAEWDTPVILSLAADQTALAAELEMTEGIAGFELRLDDPASAVAVLAAVRAVTERPLLAKIAAHDGLAATCAALAAAGADALVVGGPRPGLAVVDGTIVSGWLCGPALLPQTMAAVQLAAQAAPETPVIACGGIADAAAALAALACGARAVQLGSALLTDQRVAARVAAALTG